MDGGQDTGQILRVGSKVSEYLAPGTLLAAQVLAEVERAGLGQGQLPGRSPNRSSPTLEPGSGFLVFKLHLLSPTG